MCEPPHVLHIRRPIPELRAQAGDFLTIRLGDREPFVVTSYHPEARLESIATLFASGALESVSERMTPAVRDALTMAAPEAAAGCSSHLRLV